MTIISLIAAVDENYGLGKNNQLLCHLPADLKYFKETTLGKPIIMGRKTFDSIGKPLPGRLNIVLSRKPIHIEGVTVVNSLEQALEITQNEAEVMIIGGAQIFIQALPIADRVYLTIIHHQFDADVYFLPLSEQEWMCHTILERQHDEKNPYNLTFCRYDRIKSF